MQSANPDLMSSSYYLLLSLLLLPFLVLKLKSSSFKRMTKLKLPPGPWTLPVIGSLHHLVGRSLPHQALFRLSQRCGRHLMLLQLGELQTIVVSSKEAARELMKTNDISFCTRPRNNAVEVLTYGAKDIAFAPYGEYWRQIRKISVLELLSQKRVQSFRSIREEEVKSFIQQIQSFASTGGQVVDLSDRLFTLTNDMTLRAIMGTKTNDQEMYMREVHNIVELGTDFGVANLFPSSRLARMLTGTTRQIEKSRCNMDLFFEKIVREAREKRVDGAVEDLLGVLLRLHDEDSKSNQLTMESIKAIILDTLTGGTDTSSSTVEWAMAELIKNPKVMRKVQTEVRQYLQGCDNIAEPDLKELHYMHLVIKETLRLHPPLPLLLPRECRDTCNILGYDVPKGTMVIVNAWALGRDSNYWKDSEKFKPERFAEVDCDVQFNGDDFKYIPFGAGRRMCPGMPYALAIVELVLANLLYHFDWELPHGMALDNFDMIETFGITIRRKSHLLLRPLPYKPEVK